jgi:hypothetical protein
MADVIINDPTLAAFYEPHRIAAFEATLTHDGEIRLILIDRAAVHEDAPLKIDVTMKEDDHAVQS